MSRRAPRPVAEAGYLAYIGSSAWRNSPARLAELHASRRRCRICGRGEPQVSIEVHHNNYFHVGRERPSDLCTLCTECHGIVTSELRRRRYETLPLPLPAQARRLLAGRTLADSTHPTETGHGR